MFEEDLECRVGNNRLSIAGFEEVIDVLRDGGDTESVFAGTLNDTIEKLCRYIILHHDPCFIDNEHSLAFVTSDFGSDIVEDIEHCRSLETFFQIPDTKHRESVVEVDIGIIIKQLGKGTSDVLCYSDRESLTSLHPVEYLHQILHQGGSQTTIIIKLKCDTLEGIGGL